MTFLRPLGYVTEGLNQGLTGHRPLGSPTPQLPSLAAAHAEHQVAALQLLAKIMTWFRAVKEFLGLLGSVLG